MDFVSGFWWDVPASGKWHDTKSGVRSSADTSDRDSSHTGATPDMCFEDAHIKLDDVWSDNNLIKLTKL